VLEKQVNRLSTVLNTSLCAFVLNERLYVYCSVFAFQIISEAFGSFSCC